MLNNFIYAKQKSLFEEALNNGEVLNEAIVFIEDTKEIWNHGTYFDGSTFDPSNIEASILNIIDSYATKAEIPTKLSQLENDANYILEDVYDGVYAVDANGKLIDYNTADSSCLGVALVKGEHKFMIAKSDASDGSNSTLYWTKSYSDLSLTNYNKADGTNGSGYLPKPDGTFGGSTHLSGDFTTWKAGALSDFNGKANTAIIAAASSDARDMCTVLNTFNASDSHNDWYVPACGQLALMYLNMTEINAALAKIGGTALAALAAGYYWSSSEISSYSAWGVSFSNDSVYDCSKDDSRRVRFIRDISVSKPLKERVSELESSKQDKLVSGTNIKTINGTSILGSGDIVISGGSSCIKFTNKTASTWVSDSTYDNFKYKCDIACDGVTADMYAEVVFAMEQAVSGNYAPVCETGNGIVTIWSSVTDSITIPTIIITE